MGMPLTSLDALSALRDARKGRARSDVARMAAEALQGFRLCCFVLYDPARDHDLDDRVLRRWQSLDRGTGPDVLFFAPVDPPEVWSQRPDVRHRPLLRLDRDHSGLFQPLRSRDRSETARWLAHLFDMPAGLGASLVVSRSLWSDRGWMMTTTAQTIEGQLSRLVTASRAVSSLDRPSSESDLEPQFESQLDKELAWISGDYDTALVRSHWARPIVELMLPVLQCAALTSDASSDLGRSKLEELRQLLQASALNATSRSTRDGHDRSVQQAGVMSAIAAAACGALHASAPLPCPVGVSESARRYWMQGEDLLGVVDSGAVPSLDYRSPCLHWALAAEHELAEVLGHDVRGSLGVDLPQYRWRHQPGLHREAIDVPDGRAISFNERDPRSPRDAIARWQPPTFGPLRQGWRHWFPDQGRAGLKDFTDLWATVNQGRNPFAHPSDEITHERAIQFRQDVLRLLEAIPRWRP